MATKQLNWTARIKFEPKLHIITIKNCWGTAFHPIHIFRASIYMCIFVYSYCNDCIHCRPQRIVYICCARCVYCSSFNRINRERGSIFLKKHIRLCDNMLAPARTRTRKHRNTRADTTPHNLFYFFVVLCAREAVKRQNITKNVYAIKQRRYEYMKYISNLGTSVVDAPFANNLKLY